jgi:aspartate/methionine/tyrosine aminotransferase
MKLSWIVVNGPPSKVNSAVDRLEVIADTYLSVNTPVQNAVPAWFGFQDLIQKEINERTRRNRAHILKNLSKSTALECLHAQGGWYAVLRLPASVDEETLALELLRQDQVYVHPGYFFDFSDGPYVVVSLLPQENIFQEGFKRLLQRIR